jgi:hypothetical protein
VTQDRLHAELQPYNKTALFDTPPRPPASPSSSSPSMATATPARSRVSRRSQATGSSRCQGEIDIASAVWDQIEPDRSTVSIADAIERLTYDLLNTHCGWENNDGAFKRRIETQAVQVVGVFVAAGDGEDTGPQNGGQRRRDPAGAKGLYRYQRCG